MTLRTRSSILTFLLSLLFFGSACERQLPVLDSDKTFVLRASDLANYGYGFKGIERYETFKKATGLDGVTVEYEVETPDGELENPLFMFVMVNISRKRSDAQIGHGAEKLTLLATLKATGIVEEEIPNFYRYGDSSSFYILKKDGKPIGNYFTMREGKKTYTLVMSGFYFDDPEIWKRLMEPKLKQFSVYAP